MMRVLAIATLALGLAACHDKQPDTGKSAAAAEVLPGSASDAMIAYDTLKSQPPIAAPEHSGARDENGRPALNDDATGAPVDEPATPPSFAAPGESAPAVNAPAD